MKRTLRILFILALALLLVPVSANKASAAGQPFASNNQNLQNYEVWASPVTSMLAEENGGYLRVEFDGKDAIVIEQYDYNMKLLSAKSVTLPLPLYGGVYLSDDSNFVVCGDYNENEDDNKEVVRVIRYSKDWQELGYASLCGANTTVPFHASSLRFARLGDILLIRTAHQMYQSSDGLNHQSNMTLRLPISECKPQGGKISSVGFGYVSHSFNQFILEEDSQLIAVDHGDAYPRSVVLARSKKDAATSGNFSANSIDLLTIVGEKGLNATGVSVGGLEYSSTHYLVAGNTIEQNLEAFYEYRGGFGQKNIFVTATDKNNYAKEGTTLRMITNYPRGSEINCSTPHLVKVGSDRFLLMWMEDENLRYCFLDAAGVMTSQIYTANAILSECAPIVTGNKVIWYATKNSAPIFYQIDIENPTVVQKVYTMPHTAQNSDYRIHVMTKDGCEFCDIQGGIYMADNEWVLDENGVLTVFNCHTIRGDVLDFTPPWNSPDVKHLIVGDGVRRIDDNAFRECTNLITVTLPGGMDYIYRNAFSGTNPWHVLYKGTQEEWDALVQDKNLFGPLTDVHCNARGDEIVDAPADFDSCLIDAHYQCTVCYLSYGEEKEVPTHQWADATCTTPKTCTLCQATEGEPAHSYVNGKCSVCGAADPNYKPTTPTTPSTSGTNRLAGATRYKTAFAAADELKKLKGVDKFDAIIVSSGEEFADALAGSYLAAVKNAPILLTKDSTVKSVKEYINANLNPGGTVYLLGGEKAVPKSMESGLDGFNVKRLGGNTRYDTNLLILQEAGVAGKDIVVCTGKDFADSLSASAVGLPILLVKDSLNSAQKEFLSGNTGKIFVIGGVNAVSEKAEKQLAAYGSVTRLAGATRYKTSVLVAETFFGNPTAAVIAYGENFPDGLSGGPVAYALKSPLILTREGREKDAVAYITSKGIQSGYIQGGTTVLPEKTVNKVFGK